jgi:hypothetical protein
MPESTEEGLHGLDTVSSRLPPKFRIKTHHGAQERHRAAHERNATVSCPLLNGVRHGHVRGPEKRGLGKREGEAKRGRHSLEALKKDSNLLKRPNSSDVIYVCRHNEIVKVSRCFL